MAGENLEFDFEKLDGNLTNGETPEVEVEIVDDTPPVDRGRKPAREPVPELTDDELSTYDEKVQRRIKSAHKAMHDQRREKEAALREREEAIAFAQAQLARSRELENRLSEGSKVYIEKAHSEADLALEAAKREFKEAYEDGDSDRLVAAQERIAEATALRYNARSLKPLTPQEDDSYTETRQPQSAPQVPKPTSRDEDWLENNQWFNVHSPDYDSIMYGTAQGIHNKLAQEKYDIGSKEYYEAVDAHMHKLFPDYFGSTDEEYEIPRTKSKPLSVVAPARRSAAPSKIRLSQSQVNIAKKLGLTPEQYAVAMINMKKEA